MTKSVKQSAGGVLSRIKNDKLEFYLIKHSKYGHVLPKGTRANNESWIETAIREVKEETGYQVRKPATRLGKNMFQFEVNGVLIDKEVVFYLFEINNFVKKLQRKLDPGEKIISAKWISYKDALSIMSRKEEKDMINKAKEFIDSRK